MADPRQNYLQQLRAYAQPTAVYTPADIPASVRTYSVFDPSSNTWRRMTNNGMSPIPVQRQVPAVIQAPVQPAIVRQNIPRTASKASKEPINLDTALAMLEAQNPDAYPNNLRIDPNQYGFKKSYAPERFVEITDIPSTDIQTRIFGPARTVETSQEQRTKEENPNIRYARQLGTLPNPDPTPAPNFTTKLLNTLVDAMALKRADEANEADLGQSIPIQERQVGQFQKLDGSIAPYSFGGNVAKPDPALTAKVLGTMGLGIGGLGALALGVSPLALLGTVGRGTLSTGGRVLGDARTFGGKLGSSAIQRGKGLIDWAKTKVTRTKPNPSWQQPL